MSITSLLTSFCRYGGGYSNNGGTNAAAAAASLVVDTFAAYAAVAATSSAVQTGAGGVGTGSVPAPYDTATTSSNYVADSTTPAASSTTSTTAGATSTYSGDMEVSSVAAAVPGGPDNLMASVSGSATVVSSGQYSLVINHNLTYNSEYLN